ncbi:globin [Pseudophaeobacter sp.]|uniref:globin n=1 Tax=Pseudophaeobacter sp. TaxID=1971739 RepID=UPI003299A9ED
MDASHCRALVLQSLESDRMDLEAFIPAFYRTFFELCPEARAIFPDDTARLEAKMLASLTHMAEALEHNERLDAILSKLGQQHRSMEISDFHFEDFIKSFTAALADTLGPEWNEECHRAWTRFLEFIGKRMNFFATA